MLEKEGSLDLVFSNTADLLKWWHMFENNEPNLNLKKDSYTHSWKY